MDSKLIMEKIAESLDVEPDAICESTKAAEIGTWNSMGTMTLLLMLSDDFGINLPPNETEQLQSVEGILEIIRKHEAAS